MACRTHSDSVTRKGPGTALHVLDNLKWVGMSESRTRRRRRHFLSYESFQYVLTFAWSYICFKVQIHRRHFTHEKSSTSDSRNTPTKREIDETCVVG